MRTLATVVLLLAFAVHEVQPAGSGPGPQQSRHHGLHRLHFCAQQISAHAQHSDLDQLRDLLQHAQRLYREKLDTDVSIEASMQCCRHL